MNKAWRNARTDSEQLIKLIGEAEAENTTIGRQMMAVCLDLRDCRSYYGELCEAAYLMELVCEDVFYEFGGCDRENEPPCRDCAWCRATDAMEAYRKAIK